MRKTIRELGCNWYEGQTNGHFWQAKIYSEGSHFGISGGRISKLCIATDKTWKRMANTIYNYDRGLDFDKTPPGILSAVLKDCESVHS